MSPEIARLFTEGGPDEVVLPDCFQLNQEDLILVLTPAVTPRQVHTLSQGSASACQPRCIGNHTLPFVMLRDFLAHPEGCLLHDQEPPNRCLSSCICDLKHQ